MNGYFEETNRDKYLKLLPTNENKQEIEKNEQLWSKMRVLIGQ